MHLQTTHAALCKAIKIFVWLLQFDSPSPRTNRMPNGNRATMYTKPTLPLYSNWVCHQLYRIQALFMFVSKLANFNGYSRTYEPWKYPLFMCGANSFECSQIYIKICWIRRFVWELFTLPRNYVVISVARQLDDVCKFLTSSSPSLVGQLFVPVRIEVVFAAPFLPLYHV